MEQLSQNSAKHRAELLQALNAELGADAGRERSVEMDMSYSLDELRQFVAQSSICRHFTFVQQLEGTTQVRHKAQQHEEPVYHFIINLPAAATIH